jgi:hypothetical protein
MSNRHRLLAWCLVSATSLVMATIALGQTGERPILKWLLPGPAKSAPAPAKPPEETRRRAEIDVELAWLADPITFPYFLEAHTDGPGLVVRGYVPDKAVREHALRLARVHCSCPVSDAIKDHPSLLVRPGKMSPTQLQSAANSTLREALPKQHQHVQVQCAADGTVTLQGSLPSAEEKLNASLALRRLYGCHCVKNLVQVPAATEVAQAKSSPAAKSTAKDDPPKNQASASDSSKKPRIVDHEGSKPSKGSETKSTAGKNDPPQGPNLFPDKTSEPPIAKKKDEPTAVTKKDEPPARPSGKLSLSAAAISKLEKKVKEACSEVKNVKIEITPMSKLQIELAVANEDQIANVAGKIYSMAELMDYRDDLELHFSVGAKD